MLLNVQEGIKDTLDLLFNKRKGSTNATDVDDAMAKSMQRLPANVVAAADHAVQQHEHEEDGLQGRSLFMFGPNNRLRKILADIIWHPRFEQVIIVLICMSSITLALDSPRLDPHGTFESVLVRSTTPCADFSNSCSMLYRH